MTRLLALALALVVAGAAHADEKRPLPDYQGRGDPPIDAGDAFIWVPRVAFAPIYFVAEYVIRRPFRALTMWIEDSGVVENAIDFFGIGQPVGFVPTFYFDLSANPHFGIYFFWDAGRSSFRFSGSAGVAFVAVTMRERVRLGEDVWPGLRLHVSSRSDALFYGTGPTAPDLRSRYEIRRLEASGSLDWGPIGRSVGLQAGWRDIRFGRDTCCDDPSLADAVARRDYPSPFGFADGGYRGPFGHVHVTLDSRPTLPRAGVGASLDVEIGSDVDHDRSWVRAGGLVSASIDPTGLLRVLSLNVAAQLAEALHGDDLAFTELPGLGGDALLPGLVPGRLLGRSAIAAGLSYEWPVWVWAVGSLDVGVGNVFGPHLSGFDLDLLRLSAGIGIKSIGSVDNRFQFRLAAGTAPFSQGGGFESVRLVFGSVTGF